MDFVEHDLKSLMDTMREKQQVGIHKTSYANS